MSDIVVAEPRLRAAGGPVSWSVASNEATGAIFVSQPRDGAELLTFGTVNLRRTHHCVVRRG
jgi:hypothetical protein